MQQAAATPQTARPSQTARLPPASFAQPSAKARRGAGAFGSGNTSSNFASSTYDNRESTRKAQVGQNETGSRHLLPQSVKSGANGDSTLPNEEALRPKIIKKQPKSLQYKSKYFNAREGGSNVTPSMVPAQQEGRRAEARMRGPGGAMTAANLTQAAPVSARGPPRTNARYIQADSSKRLKQPAETFGGSDAMIKHTGPPIKMLSRKADAARVRPQPRQATGGSTVEEYGSGPNKSGEGEEVVARKRPGMNASMSGPALRVTAAGVPSRIGQGTRYLG